MRIACLVGVLITTLIGISRTALGAETSDSHGSGTGRDAEGKLINPIIGFQADNKKYNVDLTVTVTPEDYPYSLHVEACFYPTEGDNAGQRTCVKDTILDYKVELRLGKFGPGECNDVNISVTHQNVTRDSNNWSHQEQLKACTKPSKPGLNTTVTDRTCSSIQLKINHPKKMFDGFKIEQYRFKAELILSRNVTKQSGDFTDAEIQDLSFGTCYTLKIFTMSNGLLSNKPIEISQICTNNTCLGNQSTIEPTTVKFMDRDGQDSSLTTPLSSTGQYSPSTKLVPGTKDSFSPTLVQGTGQNSSSTTLVPGTGQNSSSTTLVPDGDLSSNSSIQALSALSALSTLSTLYEDLRTVDNFSGTFSKTEGSQTFSSVSHNVISSADDSSSEIITKTQGSQTTPSVTHLVTSLADNSSTNVFPKIEGNQTFPSVPHGVNSLADDSSLKIFPKSEENQTALSVPHNDLSTVTSRTSQALDTARESHLRENLSTPQSSFPSTVGVHMNSSLSSVEDSSPPTYFVTSSGQSVENLNRTADQGLEYSHETLNSGFELSTKPSVNESYLTSNVTTSSIPVQHSTMDSESPQSITSTSLTTMNEGNNRTTNTNTDEDDMLWSSVTVDMSSLSTESVNISRSSTDHFDVSRSLSNNSVDRSRSTDPSVLSPFPSTTDMVNDSYEGSGEFSEIPSNTFDTTKYLMSEESTTNEKPHTEPQSWPSSSAGTHTDPPLSWSSTSADRITISEDLTTIHPVLTTEKYNISYEISKLHIHWQEQQEFYRVLLECKRSEVNYSKAVSTSELEDNDIEPGDCCMVNVTGIGPKYFDVPVNQKAPEDPSIIPMLPTKTELNIKWQQIGRNWVDNFTINLYDARNMFRETYLVECTGQEPSCTKQDFQKQFFCSSYKLVSHDNVTLNHDGNGTYSVVVMGLRPGTTYSYNVTAHYRHGEGVSNLTTVVTDEDKPGPPLNITVRTLNLTTMEVSWEPPTVSNGVITAYRITYNNYQREVGSDITMVTLGDLDCWTEYQVNVSAKTEAGYGRDVSAVGVTNVYNQKPGIQDVIVGSNSINLSFHLPCENPPVTIDYNVSYTALDHTCTGNHANVTRWLSCDTHKPCFLTGLVSYWEYTIQVQETIGNTTGPWSDTWSNRTVPAKPDPIRNLQIVNITSSSLRVCWDRPCLINSDAVWYNISTGYITKNSTSVDMCEELSPLMPYTNYSVTVTAGNREGVSTPVTIETRTRVAEPGPPLNIIVRTINLTTMEVSWEPPSLPNGVITVYKITYNNNEREVGSDITMVTLGDLDCWTEYQVNVSAKTEAGYGRDVSAVGITNVYNQKPRIQDVIVGSNSINLSFHLPCENPPVTIGYNVSYTALDHTCTGNHANVTRWLSCDTHKPCFLTGLVSYWEYTIQVQETIGNTTGPWSDTWYNRTLPAEPNPVRNLQIFNITSSSLRVCWDRPCLINSDAVWYNISTGNITRYRNSTIGNLCEELSPLMPYTNYSVTVTAGNREGVSTPVTMETRTGIAVPNTPREITLKERHPRKLVIQWLPPLPFPGPTTYAVTSVDSSSSSKSCSADSYNQTWCTIDGLEEYWDYYITVEARTEAGVRQAQQQVKTEESAPGPVIGLQVYPDEEPRQVHVRFNPPSYRERNGVIRAYYISFSDVRSQKILGMIKLSAKNTNNSLIEHKFPVPAQILLNISVFAETIANGTQNFQTVLVPQTAKEFPILQAVLGILSVVALFIVAVIGVAVLYKKQMYCFKPPSAFKEVVELQAVKPSKKKVPTDSDDRRKNRPVKIDRFYQHVELLARDSDHFFSKEYKELKSMAPSLPTEAAETQESRLKNRYTNILPFDHSRVKLLPLDDEDGTDYINANYIPGYNSKREYIASQGPLPSTKDDFWRMIWEQNVSVIVMLTQCIERGKRKCECYWPEEVREPVFYGDLSVEIENESHLSEYVLRTITITNGNKTQKVKHIHFLKWPDFGCPETTWLLIDFVRSVQGKVKKYLKHFLYIAWPDMGVPSSSNSMIQLVKTVRSSVDPTRKGPITVHCSAGVGRTGTFIAVDIFLHQLDNDANEIDIFGEILKLRNHRCNMVQTEDQYIFIHHCLSDYILALAEDTDEEDAYDGGDDAVYENVPRR